MIYKYDAKKAKEIQNLSIQVFWKSAKGLLLNNSLNNVGLQWNWHTTFVVLSLGCINTGLVDLGKEDLDGFFKKSWTPCNTCIFSLFLFLFLVGFFFIWITLFPYILFNFCKQTYVYVYTLRVCLWVWKIYIVHNWFINSHSLILLCYILDTLYMHINES